METEWVSKCMVFNSLYLKLVWHILRRDNSVQNIEKYFDYNLYSNAFVDTSTTAEK